MAATSITCKVCGGEVTAKDPERYPYCRTCHYTGRAAEDVYAKRLAVFREAFPGSEPRIDHTGGGCFWLAVAWPGDPKFYVLTDGEAGLPDVDGEPLLEGGWGYVGRHDDTEDADGTALSNPDYEGTPLAWYSDDDFPGGKPPNDDAFWKDYPAFTMSDAQAIEVIRADIRSRELTPLQTAYRLGEGCGGLDAASVRRLVEMSRENEARS